MKAKITRGKSFKNIINYVFGPGEKNKTDRADWIGGTLGSNKPQEMIKEFETVQHLRPDINIKNPSWHCSLTLPKGEYLPDGQWSNLVDDFMDKMKFSKYNPYTIVRHNDTEFDHVHIIASKVPTIGPAWKDGREIFRAIAATQELEKEYGLTQTPGYRKRESARATYRERKKAENSGVTPPRIQLQELIDEAVADKPTAPQFAQRLEDAGVVVRASIASTGKMNGFSFELDGLAFKGSKLGKAYGWGGLQKRGVNYDAERDAEGIERYRLPVEERPPRIVEEEESTSIYIDIEKPDQEQSQESQRIRERAEALWAKVEAEREERAKTESAELEARVEKERLERLEQKERQRSSDEALLASHSEEQADEKPETEALQPKATQAPIEPNVLSETLPNEADPEITQTSIAPTALSEAPREPSQQQQWVENLAPKLEYLLVNENAHEVEGKHHTISWDSDRQRLTLRKNESQDIVLDAEWEEEGWQDNGSNLTAVEFEQLRLALDKYIRERERERQKQKSSRGFELG